MRTPLSRVVFAAMLSAVAANACGYDPQPASGTLACGTGGTCPEGYRCEGDGYCWRGDVPTSCGNTTAEKLIGHWVFIAPSRRKIVCTDGFNEDIAWTDDYVDVEEGGSAALRAFYYCDLDLDIGVTGATVLRPGSVCSAPNTNDPSIMYTWTPGIFTLATGDGCSATLAASIPYTVVSSAGTYSCTMDFTGTLTKS